MGQIQVLLFGSFWNFFPPNVSTCSWLNTGMWNSRIRRADCIAFLFPSSYFSRQCHLLVKSSSERALSAFQAKITRNTLGVEQVGFLTHCREREHTPWGTKGLLNKKKEFITGSGRIIGYLEAGFKEARFGSGLHAVRNWE